MDRRFQRNISGHSTPYGYVRVGYLPTKKLADMYLDKNGLPITKSSVFQGYDTFSSEYTDRDPRMTMTMLIPGTKIVMPQYATTPVEGWPDGPQRNPNTGYILYKYISEDAFANNSGEGGAYGGAHDFDAHLIRYAEVLLIYAEALFEKNGSVSDADLDKSINLLRDRVGMPHLSNSFVAANSLDMREEIRRERTVELALEGFRRDDLRRWKTAETELPPDIKGIKIKGSEWQNKAPYNLASYQNRVDANGFLIVETARAFDTNKHYLHPIPTKEIAFYLESGYSLEQNPGW
ncbi:MAG: RagB/SusD family nutrient uptake outer membrane protein [Mangrovibacterium sp.]